MSPRVARPSKDIWRAWPSALSLGKTKTAWSTNSTANESPTFETHTRIFNVSNFFFFIFQILFSNDRASTQWSLSSVSLAENDDVSDDELAVQRSLRNIRGSAKQRRMTRNSQLSLFKAKTPQRDAKRRNSDPNTRESTDLSVLDILSEKRKQSREKMK